MSCILARTSIHAKMRFAPIYLLIIAMATEAASAKQIVNARNEGKKSIHALTINEEASMPTDLSSSLAAGIEVGLQEDDSVNPFIVNGADLDRGVWETSRCYLLILDPPKTSVRTITVAARQVYLPELY
jgi:hypothetical protein